MLIEKEKTVTLLVAVIAIVVIVGGFASFSGLSVYETPLRFESLKTSFSQKEAFNVALQVSPVTFMSDETIILYMNDEAFGVIPIKKYLDENNIEYGSEVKNLGTNNIEIINLKEPLSVNLAEYVFLEELSENSEFLIRAELSKGDAAVEESFKVI